MFVFIGAQCADEGVRRDGLRVAGQLKFTKNGQFAFPSSEHDESISRLEIVRFQAKSPLPPSALLWHQVHLTNGDTVTAALQRVDAANLHIRTSWLDSLSISRSAVERVTNIPGERPIFYDSFEGDLSAWITIGMPRTANGKLILNRHGQSVEGKFKSSLPAGRLVAEFHSGRTARRRIVLELSFERERQKSHVRVELMGPAEHYSIHSESKPARDQRVRRESGNHRFEMEFDRDRLAMYVDERVLWFQKQGAGTLHGIKFLAEGDGDEASEIDGVLVTRPEQSRDLRTWADLTADAIRNPAGDETFGELIDAGMRGVSLRINRKTLLYSWPDVSEFTFRRTIIGEHTTTGEHVEARIRSINGTQDILSGTMKSFDEERLVLIHPLLGELTIPRRQLQELRLQFFGRRIPVDATPHHLGDLPAFGFAVPKPEGLRFTKSVEIQSPAAEGFVVVDVAHVSRKSVPVEIRVNGTSIGNLNRFADRDDGRVHSYRLPFDGPSTRKFEIEVRLRPAKNGGRIKGIDLRGLRLELPAPRK